MRITSRPVAQGGRREQQKALTKAALAEAALALTSSKGWDEVTVADIAVAADVAPRTFYRYFAGKEDAVLLGLTDFFEAYVALVAARPGDEGPMTSLVAALDAAAEVYRTNRPSFAIGLIEGIELVESIPAVAARQHYLAVEAQDRLTEIFADRLGVRPTAPEPRMFASASTAAYQCAARTWAHMPPERRTAGLVFELAREALEAFAGGLDRMVVPGIR